MPKPAVRIYHNPRCSKSRETLALLHEHGVEPEVVDYLKTPLDTAALASLLTKLKLPASAVVRKKEDAYAQAGLSATSSDTQILTAIATHPVLLERPIVEVGKRAAIGRPPENVLALLR